MGFQISGAPVAFVYVADREQALAFYCETLGLEQHSSDPYGDFLNLGGPLLRVTVMAGRQPLPHPVMGWNVDDIVTAVQALRARGVTFTIHEGFGQDALGIWTAPDGRTRLAFFADPDGNVLTLSQA